MPPFVPILAQPLRFSALHNRCNSYRSSSISSPGRGSSSLPRRSRSAKATGRSARRVRSRKKSAVILDEMRLRPTFVNIATTVVAACHVDKAIYLMNPQKFPVRREFPLGSAPSFARFAVCCRNIAVRCKNVAVPPLLSRCSRAVIALMKTPISPLFQVHRGLRENLNRICDAGLERYSFRSNQLTIPRGRT
jgi:hypothetical protein